MTVTCISDTHNKHHELNLPDADVLVHAGDFTERGTRKETEDFLNWLSSQPHEHKIFIAGNHDFYFEKEIKPEKLVPPNVHYLNNSGIQIKDFNFWGSPVTPGKAGWAFNRERGDEIRKYWNLIPGETDVLITHTPPYKIMDVLDDGTHIGCEELKRKLKKIKVKLHIFGHLHNSYGSVRIADTLFVNASCLDQRYRHINIPLTYSV
ncbi:metallophosphatase domain-containing protein [Zunongwangia sp. F363]|uniref:Metallophosphatase domain-containing protein n=1 Tax=Autumnicola tepida TaxID=3075595 RepID=A0ABU3CAL0_9FLAO|nr:metallophosphatase domain-containing protein [Zunongwangia sp. F363]MDT0643388.1 metallophosphatase domain-containing protein [Zunongwangia sp. F363]